MNEAENKAQCENILAKLKQHDFWYEYSDDIRVWRSGEETKAEICKLISLIDDEAVRNSFLVHIPEQFKNSFKADIDLFFARRGKNDC